VKIAYVILLFIACYQVVSAQETPTAHRLEDVDRAVTFAVREEIRANRLENRPDVCLGFGHGLAVDKKGIASELHRAGLTIHSNVWCNRGPRGLIININGPIRKSSQDTYDIVVELGDLRPIHQEGAHFATLLRKGTYTVKCTEGSQPELVSYSEACCPETGKPQS